MYAAYSVEEGEKTDLMEVTQGEATPRLSCAHGHANKPEAWSPDGHELLFRRNEQLVFRLPVPGDRKPAEV